MNTATKMGPTPEIGKSRGGDTAIENNSSNPSIFTIKNTVTIDTNPIIKSVFFAPGVVVAVAPERGHIRESTESLEQEEVRKLAAIRVISLMISKEIQLKLVGDSGLRAMFSARTPVTL